MLTPFELDLTARAIARVQLADGCIPWFPGGHADPWDLVEAAMALDAVGDHDAATRAYAWMRQRQRGDGAWAASYSGGEIIDETLDANFTAYIAAGAWHHFLSTDDRAWLVRMWPTVERAISFTLELQHISGAVLWARDRDYRPWPGALLTSSSCIYLSLRCALTIALELGEQRPDWELSLSALHNAITARPEAFEDKASFSMDWYYPALCGLLDPQTARTRLLERWDEFVIEGRGTRCVAERPWVTTGETCELVLALYASGLHDEAVEVFSWLSHLRDDDGGYWTGKTYPDEVIWPRQKPTWGSGAVILASDALRADARASRFFAGEGLVEPVALSEPVGDAL